MKCQHELETVMGVVDLAVFLRLVFYFTYVFCYIVVMTIILFSLFTLHHISGLSLPSPWSLPIPPLRVSYLSAPFLTTPYLSSLTSLVSLRPRVLFAPLPLVPLRHESRKRNYLICTLERMVFVSVFLRHRVDTMVFADLMFSESPSEFAVMPFSRQ